MVTQHIAEPQPYGSDEEFVVFQGLLYGDERFEPLPGYSTRILRSRPKVLDERYFIELQDERDQTIGREPVAITEAISCHGASNRQSHVQGAICLRRGAKKLLFYRKDNLIGQFPIGPPPSLKLAWRNKKVSRGKQYELGLKFSEPAEDAYLQIAYQWGERRYQAIALIDPVPTFKLDFSQLPGGKECRLVVVYTSGMRTVVEKTDTFSMEPLAPSLRIMRPREKDVFAPWHPITLEAELIDRQNDLEVDNLVWFLNGKEIAKGPLGCLQAPPEGNHKLEVRLRDQKDIKARSSFKVTRPKKVAGIPANEWDEES